MILIILMPACQKRTRVTPWSCSIVIDNSLFLSACVSSSLVVPRPTSYTACLYPPPRPTAPSPISLQRVPTERRPCSACTCVLVCTDPSDVINVAVVRSSRHGHRDSSIVVKWHLSGLGSAPVFADVGSTNLKPPTQMFFPCR